MSQRRSFTVTPIGVGRKDYSQNVEYAVASEIRSHLRRGSWCITFPVPVAWLYPNTEGLFANLVGLTPAPDIPFYIHEVKLSSDKNALVSLGFLSANSWSDVLNDNYSDVYGYAYDYGTCVLKFSRAVKTEEGKFYGMFVNEYSELGASLTFEATGLYETVVYG